jgi:hypothetical protein
MRAHMWGMERVGLGLRGGGAAGRRSTRRAEGAQRTGTGERAGSVRSPFCP